MNMKVSIIGASDMFARGIARWAVGAGLDVTIVGPSRARAEAFVEQLGRGKAAGPRDRLQDDVVFFAMPYVCVLDARDSYGSQLDGKIVVDVTIPFDVNTLQPICPAAGSSAQEITALRPAARVVKVFHPAFASAVVGTGGTDQTGEVFLAGDDVEAKRIVAKLFEDSGLSAVDVGPLRHAHELEALGHRALATSPDLPR